MDSNDQTITIGEPCGRCGHVQNAHGPICTHDGCADFTPVCWDCIAEPRVVDAESARPAFHTYALTPLPVYL